MKYIKKILPIISATAILTTPVSVFANDNAGFNIDSINTEINQNISTETNTENTISAGTNTEETSTIENNALEEKKENWNSADSWLKNCIQNMDFGGFDTSAFNIISTGSNENVTSLYTNAAKDMAANGWGKIPTDGAFSAANGFKGYSLTMADGPSNAAELFKSTFSEVYQAMKDGSFMGDLSSYDKSKELAESSDFTQLKENAMQSMKTLGDMTAMTNMINSFTGSINNEIAGFAGNDLFNSAKNGLKSIDIQAELDAVK